MKYKNHEISDEFLLGMSVVGKNSFPTSGWYLIDGISLMVSKLSFIVAMVIPQTMMNIGLGKMSASLRWRKQKNMRNYHE